MWLACSPRVPCGSRLRLCTQPASGNPSPARTRRARPPAALDAPGHPKWLGTECRRRGRGRESCALVGGGGGGAGRRPGRRRARVGGRRTSLLLWLSRYIRSRRPAALPTLPEPARAQQISTQRAFTESRRAPTERTWAERWWLDWDWGCCFWHCSYPRR